VVRFSAISQHKQLQQACNFHGAPHAGQLDVALAEIQADVSLAFSKPHHVRPITQIHSFQPVTYTGKVHGTVKAQVNAATIWQEILTPNFGDGPEGLRCFGDIFELAGRRGDLAPIASEGDSGAWVLDDAGGLSSWNGVLIGYQGVRAYACFAEHVLSAVQGMPEFPDGLVITS
jgi:hypothetical protein